ncbi:MAG: ABC transporter transmembrane domain-containing protein [Minwuia sp.]|uniref:ABC transporter transmembrane domain-containing protein n=1 Tax=Minwuia sp. TaxID=2493630 RepID=UPI003A8773B1
MERNVFSFIVKHSYRQQIVLVALAVINMPITFFGYTLVETIVNEGLQGFRKVAVEEVVDGETVSKTVKQSIEFPELVFGIGPEFDQITFLFILVGVFLINILLLQGIKYILNVYRGQTAERMLRRLRYTLFERILRFPRRTFKKVSQGELISMITAEVEPLGGFVGECFSLPVMQGGIMLMSLGYMLYANWILALAAVSLYPLQFWIIPKLQKKVNMMGKERVRRVRKLSEKIGESVTGVNEIHSNDTTNLELSNFANQLHGIYSVRLEIYIWKFVIKFVNNFIQQLGPVMFYSIGGYLVLTGGLDLGTLFAAISAHKEIGAPWKELLGYYQRQADARIKYEQVVEQFAPAGLYTEDRIMHDADPSIRLTGDLKLTGVTMLDEQNSSLVENLSTSASLGKRIALVGASGSGSSEVADLLARLEEPDRGSIQYGDHDLQTLSEAVTGRRISYVGGSSFVFNMTLGDNLFYGLRHRPLGSRSVEGDDRSELEKYISEARASGNLEYDPRADWIDYEAAGVTDLAGLRAVGIEALRIVGLDEDVYQFGLRGQIDPGVQPEIAEGVLKAREALSARLSDPSFASLIERYDPESYNTNASVAENLLFGTPVGDAFDFDHLAEHPYIQEVLEKVGMTRMFLEMGYQAAATMVELFSDLPPDHELFQQFSFISADDLPEFQAILAQYDREQLDNIDESEKLRLMSLPFKLIPARHRLGIISEDVRARLLEARKAFADNLPDDLQGAVDFFDPAEYNAAANILDNILFGKIAYGQAQAQERVSSLIREVMAELDIIDTVSEVGLAYEAGIGGARLSAGQRQKLALARAVVKNPDVLILSEATASLDSNSQARILERLLERFSGGGLIWGVHRPQMAERFDHIIVMKGGTVVESGTFEELNKEGTALSELIANEAA